MPSPLISDRREKNRTLSTAVRFTSTGYPADAHEPRNVCTLRTPYDVSSSMSIGFQADNSAVGLNESLGLTFVARNDSSAEVNSINVEIKQVIVSVFCAAVLQRVRRYCLKLCHSQYLADFPFGRRNGCS